MKKISIFLFSMFLIFSIFAQNPIDTVKYWKTTGMISITGSQLYLENWAAGGENSLASNGLLSYKADYKKDKVSWVSNLDLVYGLQKIGDKQLKKSDDKLDFASKFGYKAVNKFFYTGLIDFKSQMDVGYNYPTDSTKVKISNFMAPAYLLYTVGIDYIPTEWFAVYTSPLTGKSTFVLDDELNKMAAFGVDSGKQFRGEFGAYMKIEFQKDLMKNVNLKSKLDLFTNYEDKFKEIDVNLTLLITMKINEYLSANISINTIYDEDVKINDKNSEIQFKEAFGIGFSYKF